MNGSYQLDVVIKADESSVHQLRQLHPSLPGG